MPADLEHAISLAVEAHRGQKDRAGAPYILHPLRMMFRVETDAEKIVAVLHDVVEDTDWTLDRLRAEGFPEEVVAAVDHLTRREGESYDDFVRRAAAHPVARRVKIADLEDNMDVRRTGTVTEEDTERLTRYHRAWRSLVDDLAGG
jgi:(p)ppGpp synthase/HD superfamily hydrolase